MIWLKLWSKYSRKEGPIKGRIRCPFFGASTNDWELLKLLKENFNFVLFSSLKNICQQEKMYMPASEHWCLTGYPGHAHRAGANGVNLDRRPQEPDKFQLSPSPVHFVMGRAWSEASISEFCPIAVRVKKKKVNLLCQRKKINKFECKFWVPSLPKSKPRLKPEHSMPKHPRAVH